MNYKSRLYPTPSIHSLLLQIRRWTILKDKSGLAQLMNLSIRCTYERILNLVSPCSYLQKWWFHRCCWIKYQRMHATFTVKYTAQGKIKINITESFHKKSTYQLLAKHWLWCLVCIFLRTMMLHLVPDLNSLVMHLCRRIVCLKRGNICGGLVLAGHQLHTKVAPSLPSSAGQGK